MRPSGAQQGAQYFSDLAMEVRAEGPHQLRRTDGARRSQLRKILLEFLELRSGSRSRRLTIRKLDSRQRKLRLELLCGPRVAIVHRPLQQSLQPCRRQNGYLARHLGEQRRVSGWKGKVSVQLFFPRSASKKRVRPHTIVKEDLRHRSVPATGRDITKPQFPVFKPALSSPPPPDASHCEQCLLAMERAGVATDVRDEERCCIQLGRTVMEQRAVRAVLEATKGGDRHVRVGSSQEGFPE